MHFLRSTEKIKIEKRQLTVLFLGEKLYKFGELIRALDFPELKNPENPKN